MRHLYEHGDQELRGSILFPLCIRVNGDSSQIVFSRLDEPWRIGLPDSTDLRNDFLERLRRAMHKFHSAGVVHLDLYLSNVMWRMDPSNPSLVQIQIIDWDSAHFVSEILEKRVVTRLYEGRIALAAKFGPSLTSYDFSLFKVIEQQIENVALRSSSKSELDKSFKDCVMTALTSLSSEPS